MKLILVRHAMPEFDDSLPPHVWPLSESGRQAAIELADELADRSIGTIVSSEEPKSRGTAEAIAGRLGLPWSTASGLHEHRRGPMKWHGHEARHALLQRLFDNPEGVVFGDESANEALERFSLAVAAVIQQADARAGALCIVSHGTVMSLFVARHLDVAPYSIWRQLECSDYVELEISR